MAFTRILWRASSSAALRVRPSGVGDVTRSGHQLGAQRGELVGELVETGGGDVGGNDAGTGLDEGAGDRSTHAPGRTRDEASAPVE